MINFFLKVLLISNIFIFLSANLSLGEIVKKINFIGNDRIADETVKTFSSIKINDDIDEIKINSSLKSLFESNFFKNVSINFIDNILTIVVEENPIVQNLKLEGIKAERIREEIFKNLNLKQRGSFLKKI